MTSPGQSFKFLTWVPITLLEGLTTWEAMMVDENKAQPQLEQLQFEIQPFNPLYYQDTVSKVGKGSLAALNLSHNSLVGLQEPFSIPFLIALDLHSNRLQGKIPPPSARYLDHSNNNFSNSIPHDIGNLFSMTLFFSLSNNKLIGVIPKSICEATYLQVLDLSSNNLSGSIPACLIQRSKYLNVLNVRRNSLNSTIPDKFPANRGLRTINMNGNHLEGIIPKSLANCRVLEVLDLGHNHINDAFPCWLKNVSSLRVLVLQSNRFNGNINCLEHDVSWPTLQIFDLGSNYYNGRLPQKGLTTWEAMMVDENNAQPQLEHLQFEIQPFNHLYYQDTVTVTSKGLEMELVKILTLFNSIDLSSNKFQGKLKVIEGNKSFVVSIEKDSSPVAFDSILNLLDLKFELAPEYQPFSSDKELSEKRNMMETEGREVWANVRSRKDVRKTDKISHLSHGLTFVRLAQKTKESNPIRVGVDSSTTSSDSDSEEGQQMRVGKSKGECSKWRQVSKGSGSRRLNGLGMGFSRHGFQKSGVLEKGVDCVVDSLWDLGDVSSSMASEVGAPKKILVRHKDPKIRAEDLLSVPLAVDLGVDGRRGNIKKKKQLVDIRWSLADEIAKVIEKGVSLRADEFLYEADYQRKIDVCKQKIEQAKSEVAAEAEVDHLQKELEEEFEKERLLQEELR
ncbi:hypothetical protein LWI29_026585 [Acer saccharum]|uniref:Uncharacterized protein n=1 Tax=Acer saccharum TaxID=4024 RepID=A0AA39S6G0_ACESA|nr:hypothetical protein LWI29_026585 [Acer saccharum]